MNGTPRYRIAFQLFDQSNRLGSALLIAEHLHREQTRKGSDTPYFSHLMAVAGAVMEYGGDEDEVIAALLHDAVEDQGGAPVLEEIRIAFGDRVAEMVDACSDTDETPKPPWRARKEKHLSHLPHSPVAVLRIIAADKTHNLRSMLRDHYVVGKELWSRFNASPRDILWYHREALEIIRQKGLRDMADEMQRVLDELEKRIEIEERLA